MEARRRSDALVVSLLINDCIGTLARLGLYLLRQDYAGVTFVVRFLAGCMEHHEENAGLDGGQFPP